MVLYGGTITHMVAVVRLLLRVKYKAWVHVNET